MGMSVPVSYLRELNRYKRQINHIKGCIAAFLSWFNWTVGLTKKQAALYGAACFFYCGLVTS